MKTVILGLLLTSGFAFAQNSQATTNVDKDTLDQQRHFAWYTRDALESQSPRIHLAKRHHKNTVRSGDQLEISKSTITAFIPYGK